MEMNFCRRCGTKLTKKSAKVYQCENRHITFENPAASVGVFFLTDDGKVMLSVRGIEPHKGMLDAFGGFVDQEETLEGAVARELKEELNLDAPDYEPIRYLGSATGHYPYDGEVYLVITALFWTRLKTEAQLVAQDDVAAINIIPLMEVDFTQLHDDDIRFGIKKLQDLFSSKSL